MDVTSVDDLEIPRYPPFLKGLPVAAPARIVATQRELIGRLQDALAFTDARFSTLVRPVVERYAAFVHLLPASEAHHHRGAGGLFRHGLEVAFHAAQASQGRIFALDRSPAERRELEPRWHLAAGLAGLCHDIGKPVSDLSVSDREGRTTWRPLLGSLTDWAATNGVAHYFLRWRERRHARHETFGLLVLERILTPEVTAWLVDADPEIMQGLLSAVAGIDDGAALGSLVTEADRACVERDLRENHIDPATVSLGVPVDRYLLDAMRRLARGGRWQINVPGARLWMLAEGLHLVWPAGAEDVVGLLAADKVPGIPRDPDTLADILLERGLAVPRKGGVGTQRYWRLAPAPLARDGQVVTLSMLRLASPELVLAGAPPAAVGLAVASEPVTWDAGTKTPAESSAGEGREKTGRQLEEGTSPAGATPPSASAQSASAEDTGTRDPAVSAAANPRTPATPDPHVLSENPQAQGQTAETIAGQGPDPGNQRGEAVAKATAWLGARGTGGETLLALTRILSGDPGAWDQRIRRKGEQLVVLFPDGLADLGAPAQARLEALASNGLLDINPLTPLRRVIEVEGKHGALLTVEASRQILALFAGERMGTPKPVEETLPAADPAFLPPGRGDPKPETPTVPRSRRRDHPPPDLDPARALVERVRAGEKTLLGGVSRADGWLAIGPEAVRNWAQAHGVQSYVLIRTLGHLPGCRVTPDGGLAVREAP
jgi:conjugal transfer pilus assembly protein TraI